MESQNMEYEVSAEYALHDAMDKVLAYLNARDLCRAAQVCRSWDRAVQWEFSKRGPERILIPHTYDPRLAADAAEPRFHLASLMRAKPDLVIAFFGPRPHNRCSLDNERDFMIAYKTQIPHRMIVFGVDVSMMDEKELRCAPSSHLPSKPPNGVQGFFIPNVFRQCRIQIGSIESHEHEVIKKANGIVDSIMPADPNAKSTILLFGRTYYSIHKHVLFLIKQRFKPNSYTIWGGTTRDYLKMIDGPANDYPYYTGMEGCIAVNITGPSLERHSLLITIFNEMAAIERELADFEKGLKLKRHSNGFICGPRRRPHIPSQIWKKETYDNENVMRIVKKVFPNVPFVGFFSDTDTQFYGMNSREDDAGQVMIYNMHLSILILTHD